MPYIKKEDRERLDPTNKGPLGPDAIGELNFCITRLCDEWLGNHGVSYTSMNAIIGALDCAKMEFYRRVAVPYEDTKMKENGDVYTA